MRATQGLLETPALLDYSVSKKEVQIHLLQVIYLGYELRWKKTAVQAYMVVIMQIPAPITKKQFRWFLGAVGYYHLWITGLSEIAKPCTVTLTTIICPVSEDYLLLQNSTDSTEEE